MDYDFKCLDTYKYLFDKHILNGKVALVTGGGSGIGFTISEILLRHGCNVVICSRSLDRLNNAIEVFKKNLEITDSCIAIRMDVRNENDIKNATAQIIDKFGKIDFLINCAAGNFLSPISGLSKNAFKTVMDIDAVGTFLVSKIVFEKCLRDCGGVILNITATLHYRGTIFQAHAGAAKAAVDALTKHMAVEWGPHNVRVVGVAPGPIFNTEGMHRLNPGNMNFEKTVPLQRVGKTLDVAHLVLFLVSDAASFISGEVIVVDGGHWLTHGNSFDMLVSKM